MLQGPVVSYQAYCRGEYEHGFGPIEGACLWQGPLRLVSNQTKEARSTARRLVVTDRGEHIKGSLEAIDTDRECPGQFEMLGHRTSVRITRRK